MIKEKYTSPAHLAGQAGSADGILIGRAITERPDLFAATYTEVGVLDTLRIETTANGIPNIQEYGANDRRADPWQSAKMATRLQTATASGKPVLLRVDYNAGHGAGASRTQYHERLADIYAFLFEHLK